MPPPESICGETCRYFIGVAGWCVVSIIGCAGLYALWRSDGLDTWKKVGLAMVPATLAGFGVAAWLAGFAVPAESSAVFFAGAWGIVFMVLLLVILLLVAEKPADFLLWFGVGSVGAAAGWVVGILVSPASEKEATYFSSVQSTLLGLMSGALATQVGALWQKLIEGSDPKIFRRAYAVPLLIFAASSLVSSAVQFNIRAYGRPSIIVNAPDWAALPIDAHTKHKVWDGKRDLRFSALVGFPSETGVEWSLQPAKVDDDAVHEAIRSKAVHINRRRGRLKAKRPRDVMDLAGKVVHVVAQSRWNHDWSTMMPVQLGTAKVAGTVHASTSDPGNTSVDRRDGDDRRPGDSGSKRAGKPKPAD